MRALFDVNALIALVHRQHIHHDAAHAWLGENLASGWASCPLTQNGFVRIMSQPKFPGSISSGAALDLLRRAIAAGNHEFWSDDLSLADSAHFSGNGILAHHQVTDSYLLALAASRRGRLVTFDRALSARAAIKAEAENLVIL